MEVALFVHNEPLYSFFPAGECSSYKHLFNANHRSTLSSDDFQRLKAQKTISRVVLVKPWKLLKPRRLASSIISNGKFYLIGWFFGVVVEKLVITTDVHTKQYFLFLHTPYVMRK